MHIPQGTTGHPLWAAGPTVEGLGLYNDAADLVICGLCPRHRCFDHVIPPLALGLRNNLYRIPDYRLDALASTICHRRTYPPQAPDIHVARVT